MASERDEAAPTTTELRSTRAGTAMRPRVSAAAAAESVANNARLLAKIGWSWASLEHAPGSVVLSTTGHWSPGDANNDRSRLRFGRLTMGMLLRSRAGEPFGGATVPSVVVATARAAPSVTETLSARRSASRLRMRARAAAMRSPAGVGAERARSETCDNGGGVAAHPEPHRSEGTQSTTS